MGSTTLFSTLFNLRTMNAAAIANSAVFGGDFKALVCIFLDGGNDSYNMLIPKQNNEEYNTYAETRSNVAIPQEDILDLNGSDYGLHPSLTDLQTLYDDGKLSFITNIGTLIEPTDIDGYYNETSELPLGLYSHGDQFQQWQTSVPHERTAIGWGGKVADLVQDMNTDDTISMNISLAGSNIFLRGNNVTEYTLDGYSGANTIDTYGDEWEYAQALTTGVDSFVEAEYQNLFKKTYIDILKVSRDSNQLFQDALDNVTLNTVFEDDDLSFKLEMTARSIAAREDLGQTRQIYFVDFGGFDLHDAVLADHADRMTAVNDALSSFYEALVELNVADCVTTFGVSEFARTLTSNGNGTDHGWGGNVFIMGDAVNGGQIYGNYPNLALGSNLDVGGGVLIPTTSCDEYFAELAMWFGIEASELSTIFPNIGNFYDVTSGVNPIGFL